MSVELSPSVLISELLDQYPQLIPVFLSRGMACVGCSMARFETLGAAAQVYHLDWAALADQCRGILSDPT